MATKSAGEKKAGGGFMKPVQPDDLLAAVVGNKPLPRTEITRKLWDYIRANKLQDPKRRTVIRADDKLRPMFDGKAELTMFEMTKHVFGHTKS